MDATKQMKKKILRIKVNHDFQKTTLSFGNKFELRGKKTFDVWGKARNEGGFFSGI